MAFDPKNERTTAQEREAERRIVAACKNKPVRKVTTAWIIERQPWRHVVGTKFGQASGMSISERLLVLIATEGPQKKDGLHLRLCCTYKAMMIAVHRCSKLYLDYADPNAVKICAYPAQRALP